MKPGAGHGPRLPDFAILGVRIMQPGAHAAVALGIVDTGAGFSAMTASAAQLLKAQAGQQAVTGFQGRLESWDCDSDGWINGIMVIFMMGLAWDISNNENIHYQKPVLVVLLCPL